jgi:hypothetical protein
MGNFYLFIYFYFLSFWRETDHWSNDSKKKFSPHFGGGLVNEASFWEGTGITNFFYFFPLILEEDRSMKQVFGKGPV